MQTKPSWIIGRGILAAAAIVVLAAAALSLIGSLRAGDDRIETARNVDSTGGSAVGVCVEGVPDCVDTVVNPDGDVAGGNEEPADPDEPVSSEPGADEVPGSSDLVPPDECSAVHNIEACQAEATKLALSDLSGRLGVATEEIAVESVESATWDGCLGLPPAEGEVCTEIGIPGYTIILEHAATQYEYHTDSGTRALLAP